MQQYLGKSESLLGIGPSKMRLATGLLNGLPRKAQSYLNPVGASPPPCLPSETAGPSASLRHVAYRSTSPPMDAELREATPALPLPHLTPRRPENTHSNLDKRLGVHPVPGGFL